MSSLFPKTSSYNCWQENAWKMSEKKKKYIRYLKPKLCIDIFHLFYFTIYHSHFKNVKKKTMELYNGV